MKKDKRFSLRLRMYSCFFLFARNRYTGIHPAITYTER